METSSSSSSAASSLPAIGSTIAAVSTPPAVGAGDIADSPTESSSTTSSSVSVADAANDEAGKLCRINGSDRVCTERGGGDGGRCDSDGDCFHRQKLREPQQGQNQGEGEQRREHNQQHQHQQHQEKPEKLEQREQQQKQEERQQQQQEQNVQEEPKQQQQLEWSPKRLTETEVEVARAQLKRTAERFRVVKVSLFSNLVAVVEREGI